MIKTGMTRELVDTFNAERHELELLNPLSPDLEKGSVEAGLVLIPTTLFFLMVIQIIIAGSWQVLERSNLHDLVIRSNIKNEDVEFASSKDKGIGSNLSWQNGQRNLSLPDNQSDTDDFEVNSLAGNYDRSLSVTKEDSNLGQIKRYELTSSIPILGDFFFGLVPDLFQVRNYVITVT